MSWQIGAVANAVTAVAYVAIALVILTPLVQTKQLRTNPLGLATAGIFFTCAVHHGHHALHMGLPLIGQEVEVGTALRSAWRWDIAIWDVVTASVAIVYWMQRKTYGSLMRGAQLFDDLHEKQRQALEINDNIVQGLTVAQMALELNHSERSEEAIANALIAARGIITDLLGEAKTLAPGDLRRSSPAKVK